MRARLFTTLLLTNLVSVVFSCQAIAGDSRNDVTKTLAKSEYRGQIVFKSYCALCHGERGDGKARATKLHGEPSLIIGNQSNEYYEKIIRSGGESMGKSPMMPPWGDELTDEQVTDVIAYMHGVTDPLKRGEAVFKTNCILCHGINADGQGRAAKLYDPPPANLRKSDKNDEYKRQIITLGGEAMGRSSVMPIWGKQLSTQEIEDVVGYLRTVLD